MKNPFLSLGYIDSNVSINRLELVKLPIDHIQDEIRGKTAHDIFSTSVFIEEIKKKSKELKLDLEKLEEKMLPIYLEDCIDSADMEVSKVANDIVRIFGERLGLILLTLRKGDNENRTVRKDWTDEYWDYWKYIKTVILVGGLASGRLGELLKYHIHNIFNMGNEEEYEIVLVKNSSNAGIVGCASYVPEKDSNNLIFDFGQSYIKRSLVSISGGDVVKIKNLDKKLSLNMDWEFDDIDVEKLEGIKLHNHLIQIICDTYNEIKKLNSDLRNLIVISIANYVNNGTLLGRGGYAKLRLLSDNYEDYISSELSKKLDKNIKVKLVHDGTAMAAAFSNYNRAVCVSLGTAFGVGFPTSSV